MEICKKKIFFILFLIFFILTGTTFSQIDFKKLGDKKVSYLDFFLLKFETTIAKRSQVLRRQMFATRVQYSSINVQVDFDNKRQEIFINIYAVMDKNRYEKKRYEQKLSDCNQIRNKIFVKKYGYSFFKQTLNYAVNEENLSEVINNEILNISSLDKNLKQSILDNTIIKIKVIHPKKERNIK